MNQSLEYNQTDKSETEPKITVTVYFLFNCKTVDSLIERLRMLSVDTNVAMLDEYDLSIEDINTNLQRIIEGAKERSIDIILAADNQHRQIGDQFKQVSWDIRREEILSAGATLLDEGIPLDEIGDSIGFYFTKDGKVYAFPKTWKHPIHIIPNTKIAVSVCGEIAHLTPEQLENLDIDIIYNPSREKDDPYLKYRMLGLFNPNITDEEIHTELMKDMYYRNLAEGNYGSEKRDYSDMDEYTRGLMEQYDKDEEEGRITKLTPEDLKREYEIEFNKIKLIIRDQKNDPSMYVSQIKEVLDRKGIVVVRSDGEETSGVLNLPKDIKIDAADYGHRQAKISFTRV